MAKTIFVGPGGVAHASDKLGTDPGRFFVGLGSLDKGRAIGAQGFELGEDFFVRLRVEARADMPGETQSLAIVQAEKERTEGEPGPPGGGPAADDRVDGVRSFDFEPVDAAVAHVTRVNALGDDAFEAVLLR